jgi:nucleotide-binding universal stress UspA family protein
MRLQTLLVPVDFSAHSDKALGHAIKLAIAFGGRIHLLHAYQTPITLVTPEYVIPIDAWKACRDDADRKLSETARKVRGAGVEADAHVAEVPAARAIVEAAEKIGADLILMGTHGRTGLRHVMLGSVAERTIRTAPCPVMTVKAE